MEFLEQPQIIRIEVMKVILKVGIGRLYLSERIHCRLLEHFNDSAALSTLFALKKK